VCVALLLNQAPAVYIQSVLRPPSMTLSSRTTTHILLMCCMFQHRLVPGWDVLCVEQLAAAQQSSPTEKAVLSTYPLGYTGEGAAASVPEEAPATLLCAYHFDQQGMMRTTGR
jgi:hypothetical protein